MRLDLSARLVKVRRKAEMIESRSLIFLHELCKISHGVDRVRNQRVRVIDVIVLKNLKSGIATKYVSVNLDRFDTDIVIRSRDHRSA